MKKIMFAVFSLFIFSQTSASEEIPGLSDIQSMAGCFDITYRFFEDGPHPKDNHPDPFYTMLVTNREWVTFLQNQDNPNQVQIERFIAAPFLNPPSIAQHLAEDWTYSTKNKSWTQHTYINKDFGNSAERSTRYICKAPWNFHQRTCIAPKSALPVRHKHAGRNYQYLDRNQTDQVTDVGWIQVSHNMILNETLSDGTVRNSSEVGWIENRKLFEIKTYQDCFPNTPLTEYAKRKLEAK